jgi:hypothetical protein
MAQSPQKPSVPVEPRREKTAAGVAVFAVLSLFLWQGQRSKPSSSYCLSRVLARYIVLLTQQNDFINRFGVACRRSKVISIQRCPKTTMAFPGPNRAAGLLP